MIHFSYMCLKFGSMYPLYETISEVGCLHSIVQIVSLKYNLFIGIQTTKFTEMTESFRQHKPKVDTLLSLSLELYLMCTC